MIYIEEKSFTRQIDVIDLLSSLFELDVIYWLYLESSQTSICDLPLADKEISEGEQITTYWKDKKPNKTKRIGLTKTLLAKTRVTENNITSNCDSIALYRPNEHDWFACAISHEGMCLIRDDSFLEELKNKGFNASTTKPDWW